MVKIAIFTILAILPPGACPSGTVRATRPGPQDRQVRAPDPTKPSGRAGPFFGIPGKRAGEAGSLPDLRVRPRTRDLAARPGPPARTARIRTRPQIRWIWGRVGPDFDDPGHTKPDRHTLAGGEVRFSPAGVGVLAVLALF